MSEKHRGFPDPTGQEMPGFYPVYRAINKPLTILGTERRLFFLAAIMAGATFNFFASLKAAAIMYAALYAAARWVTAKDLALPKVLLNSARFKVRYDSGRFEPTLSMRFKP